MISYTKNIKNSLASHSRGSISPTRSKSSKTSGGHNSPKVTKQKEHNTIITAGSSAGKDHLDWASSILSAVGEVVVVDETTLDAVTGLSGSGPAYLFLLAEAMIASGKALKCSID